MNDIVLRLGVIAGFTHHFTCQYRKQVDVFAALCVWMIESVLFLVGVFISNERPTLAGFCIALLVFNIINVNPFREELD